MSSPKATAEAGDVEARGGVQEHLMNTSIHTLAWKDVTVIVEGRGNNGGREILSNVSGRAKAGQLFALMGPSGCGKTTLLNALAHRHGTSNATTEGAITVNGIVPSLPAFQQASCYVEQEDALIGSLTARETLDFAARLALPRAVPRFERKERVEALLAAFGLQEQAESLIGTPIRKGLSGGQKRRVGVAAQLITAPKMLFLDEPASGLDAVASFEVMSFLKQVAVKNNLLIIASIHQPSTLTFQLFDTLLLLSRGRTAYHGPVSDVMDYFASINHPVPPHTNPAEFLLQLTNVDFGDNNAQLRLEQIQNAWSESSQAKQLQIEEKSEAAALTGFELQPVSAVTRMLIPLTLVHRSFIKSYRDVVAYGIRFAMYTGLAIMMGTVWLRLPEKQEAIQPFVNAIFFGSAFMSFMAVAYVPAFLEDRASFVKERANGLYGAAAFSIANFIIGLPYLFLISLLFSIIAYWLSNFRPSATAFFTWVMWLFLDLVAAESLVVLVSSVMPTFVVALAVTAFANGLWMSVGGFLVTPKILNVFYRYVFSYIDYQAYVFRGMMVNEFSKRTYACTSDPTAPNGCACMYQTALASECRVAGTGVLEAYGYAQGKTGKWVGIMLGIVLGYRLLGWLALWMRKT